MPIDSDFLVLTKMDSDIFSYPTLEAAGTLRNDKQIKREHTPLGWPLS